METFAFLAAVVAQAAVAVTPDATAIAVFVGGVLQPYARALFHRVTGYEPSSTAGGRAYTAALALLVAVVATYVSGGFATFVAEWPTFSWADPSPLVAYLAPKFAAVYTLSHLVFGSTERYVRKVAGATTT